MKWALRIVLALLLLTLAVAIVPWVMGARLPREHHVARAVTLHQPPDSVWAVIADFEHAPTWRSDLERVERGPDRNGHPVWIEVSPAGRQPLEVLREVPDRLLELRIADDKLPYGGTWTLGLEPAPEGTTLTIREDGWVKPALFRFLMHYVFKPTSTIDGYLRVLGRRFGEDVTPRDA